MGIGAAGLVEAGAEAEGEVGVAALGAAVLFGRGGAALLGLSLAVCAGAGVEMAHERVRDAAMSERWRGFALVRLRGIGVHIG